MKFPLFTSCSLYYYSVWNKLAYGKCLYLTDISLEFDKSSIVNFNRTQTMSIMECENKDVIDKICAFILSFAPNIRKYKLIANNECDNNFKHLIGYYDRLESLYTDSVGIITNVRMISLKKLILQRNSKKGNFINLKLKLNNLNCYINLETFKCVYMNKSKNKWNGLYGNIVNFIEYVAEQKQNKYLKYIGIYHRTPNNRKPYAKKEYKRIEYFDLRQISKDNSLELCKLIIALTTSMDNNLKSIELNPIALKQKELKYLYFWYNSDNGGFDANNYMKRSDIVLTNLYCSM